MRIISCVNTFKKSMTLCFIIMTFRNRNFRRLKNQNYKDTKFQKHHQALDKTELHESTIYGVQRAEAEVLLTKNLSQPFRLADYLQIL